MHLKLFPLLCCAGPDVHYTNLFVCVFVFVSLDVSLLLSCAGTGGRFESWYGVYVCLCFFGVSWCVLMFFPSVLALMNNIKVCLCVPLPGTSVAAVHQSQYKIQCNKVQRGKKYKSRENATYTLQQYTQIFGTIDSDKNNKTIV